MLNLFYNRSGLIAFAEAKWYLTPPIQQMISLHKPNKSPHSLNHSYDPDRFAPEREEDKAAGQFSYISFGGGRHGCLGEPFAYLQIKAIWSHLLRNFEFELISPFPENNWNAMVVGIKGEVMVRYRRRKLTVDWSTNLLHRMFIQLFGRPKVYWKVSIISGTHGCVVEGLNGSSVNL